MSKSPVILGFLGLVWTWRRKEFCRKSNFGPTVRSQSTIQIDVSRLVIISGVEYRLRNSSLCTFLHRPFCFRFINILFSNIETICIPSLLSSVSCSLVKWFLKPRSQPDMALLFRYQVLRILHDQLTKLARALVCVCVDLLSFRILSSERYLDGGTKNSDLYNIFERIFAVWKKIGYLPAAKIMAIEFVWWPH
jgi:hypothetical protein